MCANERCDVQRCVIADLIKIEMWIWDVDEESRDELSRYIDRCLFTLQYHQITQ